MILFSILPSLCSGQLLQLYADTEITHLLVDSRKPILTKGALFFAIVGDRHDAHQHIAALYKLYILTFKRIKNKQTCRIGMNINKYI